MILSGTAQHVQWENDSVDRDDVLTSKDRFANGKYPQLEPEMENAQNSVSFILPELWTIRRVNKQQTHSPDSDNT